MPINQCDIVVFDFETGGLDTAKCEVIQVAGKAINGRTLQPYPEGEGEFCSLMRPLDMNNLEARALEVNGKTREELREAPEREVVWRKFCGWVQNFNRGKGVTTLPIAAGQNIVKFDLPIAERLCRFYNLCRKKNEFSLFNPAVIPLDLKAISFLWFENLPEPANYKLDTFRDFFGLTHEGGHDALVDVRQTAELVIRFMKLHRHFAPKVPFKRACAAAAS